ncbi:type 2 lanthipeptide synthetase LanM [Xanthobacteraceae bacterium A53D]
MADLAAIVGRAAFMNERLAAATLPNPAPRPSERAMARSRRLHEAMATGGDRISVPDVCGSRPEAELLSVFDDDLPVLRHPLPDWASTLHQVIAAGREDDLNAATDDALIAGYPFGAILLPFVHVARQKMRAGQQEVAFQAVSVAARSDIDRALMAAMVEVLGECLLSAFAQRRPAGPALVQHYLGHLDTSSADAHYRAFVADLRSDGGHRFFAEYPVAARLAAGRLGSFVAAACELLTRFAADRDRIWPDAGNGRAEIAEITLGLSDPHGGGRSVAILTSADGRRIVYKPRSLAPEEAWNSVLRHLDADLRRPRIIARETYGWMEFIAPAACTSRDDVELFFRRLGQVMCAAYVFGGKDFHRENLIAAGNQPVLVDLETLGQPDPRPIVAMDDPVATLRQDRIEAFWSSVLRAEFLPRWHIGFDGNAHDESALSSPADHRSVEIEWRGLNTDVMTRVRVMRDRPGTNLPSLHGIPMRAEEHADAILAGFAQAWGRLGELGPGSVAEGGPLAVLRAIPFRFIFRATDVYYALLRTTTAPENLRCGLDFSIPLHALYRAVDAGDPELAQVVAAEIRALEQGDIPRFEGRSDACVLQIEAGHLIPGYLATSGIEAVQQRLTCLDAPGLGQQLRLISMVLAGARSRRGTTGLPARRPTRHIPQDLLGIEQAVDAACAIGDEVLDSAIVLPDRSLCWAGLTYQDEAAGLQIDVMDDGLYEGNAGIGLFLAALYRARGETRHRDGAYRALARLRTVAARPSRPSGEGSRHLGLGAGIGGQIYALARAGDLLGDAALFADALSLAGAISEDDIAAQTEWDILGGTAGAVAGLLALAGRSDDRAPLVTAARCGRHALAHIRALDPAAGMGTFAHGVTGAAAMLVRLARRTSDENLLKSALEILDGAGDPCAGHGGAQYRHGWCNGSAGIGLARLVARASGDDWLDPVLDAAIHEARTAEASHTDQICCGHLGMVDLLLSAGTSMGRPELERDAWRQADAIVRRARGSGGYRLLPGVPPSYAGAGLFQGLSGIGYQLLRLAAPQRFTSILLVE